MGFCGATLQNRDELVKRHKPYCNEIWTWKGARLSSSFHNNLSYFDVKLMTLLFIQLKPSKIIKELEGEKEVKGGQKSSQNIQQIKKPSLPVCEQQYLGLMTLFVQTGAERRKLSRLKNIAVM